MPKVILTKRKVAKITKVPFALYNFKVIVTYLKIDLGNSISPFSLIFERERMAQPLAVLVKV